MIQIPPGAGPVLRFAAAELGRLAPWLSGAEAEVLIGPADWAAATASRPVGKPPGHPDGYLLAGDGDRYALLSRTERGALYAVYGLLEQMGARWPHPGLTAAPEEQSLPRVDKAAEPSYDLRGTCLTGPATTEEVLRLLDWSGKRGLNALQVERADGLDKPALALAAEQRGIGLQYGPLAAFRPAGRCFKHSIGNPYGCTVNPALFRGAAGQQTAAEPYGDLLALGRPANLATVIRQDLEDYFRESIRAFYLVHHGPLSWWSCPLNFDVYARTLWDLNTDPAEVLVALAAGDDDLERALGQAEEAAGAALCGCCSPESRAARVAETASLLPAGSLERALHEGDRARAVAALEALPRERRGRFGDEIYLPHLRRHDSDGAPR